MNLNDLLKVSNVRCIKTKVQEDLVEGEIYEVEGFNDETIKIVDRNGYSSWHNKNLFEPVHDNDMSKSNNEIDISKNSVGDVNTTFKVGDKVYVGLTGRAAKVTEIIDDEVVSVANENNKVRVWTTNICHATQENCEMLSKLYPHIEIELPTKQLMSGNLCRAVRAIPHIQFELPPKEITGSDLTKGMFERGDFAAVCKCSDTSESSAITFSPLRLIVGYSNGRFEENNGKCWNYAVPFDPKTEIPLTEDVLNETI